jgi:RimJ/RimL family protein N-acetyltransferase
MSNIQLGRHLLTAVKATAGMPGPPILIPVGAPPEAFLRPVATRKELLNSEDVHKLTEWRNQFVQAFLTEFQATKGRTAQWLTEVVGPTEGKILFMVDDLNGRPFGYMGLDYIDWEQGYGEADAVVRGSEAPSGTMKRVLLTLLRWAQGQLGLREIGVRVRSDNTALEFYRKAGFYEIRRVPLRRVEEADLVRWVEDLSVEGAVLYLAHMRWQPSELGRLSP